MLDIGWSEMAVIALVALVVIGPKDLPKVMRAASHWLRKARSLAREFQSGVDDMIREADLEDARQMVESARSLDVGKAIGDTVDPSGALSDEVRDIEKTARDAATPETVGDGGDSKKPAAAPAKAAEEISPNIAPPHSLTPPSAADAPAATPEPAPPAAATSDGGKQATQT